MCCPLTKPLKNFIFKELLVEEIDCLYTITQKINKKPRQTPFTLTYNSITIDNFKTKLIYGGGSRITPFGALSNEDVEVLGEKTNSLIKRFF